MSVSGSARESRDNGRQSRRMRSVRLLFLVRRPHGGCRERGVGCTEAGSNYWGGGGGGWWTGLETKAVVMSINKGGQGRRVVSGTRTKSQVRSMCEGLF